MSILCGFKEGQITSFSQLFSSRLRRGSVGSMLWVFQGTAMVAVGWELGKSRALLGFLLGQKRMKAGGRILCRAGPCLSVMTQKHSWSFVSSSHCLSGPCRGSAHCWLPMAEGILSCSFPTGVEVPFLLGQLLTCFPGGG